MLQIGTLPRKEKSVEILRGNRLNFRAQPVNCEPMNSRKQATVTPFLFGRIWTKFAPQDKTFCFEREECRVNFRTR